MSSLLGTSEPEGSQGRPEPLLVSEGLRILGALRRRRNLLLGSVLAALALATLYNETARPLYRAAATLDLAPENADAAFGGARWRAPTEDDLFRAATVLRSWPLAQRIVRDPVPRLAAELQEGSLLSTEGRFLEEWADLQRRLSARLAGAPSSTARPPAPASSVEAFLSRLSIAEARRGFVSVAFLAYDPEAAVLAANAVVDGYIAETQRSRREAFSRQRDWMSERLAEQKKQAGEAQGVLQKYEVEQGLLNLEESQRLTSQKLAQLSAALDQSRTARLTKEALRREMGALSPQALADFPPMRSTEAVKDARAAVEQARREHARLSKSLGEKHPDLLGAEEGVRAADKRLGEELGKALAGFDADLSAMRAEEETLRTSVGDCERELKETREKAIQYQLIKRDSETSEQALKDLMSRTKGANLAGELQLPPARVADRARVPTSPSSPQRARNYRLALVAGLAVGLLLVFLTESFDDSVKIPDDLLGHVDVPFLGLVPEARMVSKRDSPATPLIHLNPSQPLQEAYRIVRTNLLYSGAPDAARMLLVSSVGPSEGKSTSVVNLALSLAANGARVLVVDADLRRPSLHTKLGVASSPGLSDLVLGTAQLDEVIRSDIFERIDLITCGRATSAAAELLGQNRMRELLREFRKRYDWVLVDGPPILAIADASILCGGADGVLLVIAAERCARNGVRRAVAQVRGVGGTVIGTLLNRVDFERNPYYYGHYYGDYYRSYYRSDAKRRDDGKQARLS